MATALGGVIAKMPLYKSHKTVSAIKIAEIQQSPADEVCRGGSWRIIPTDQDLPPIVVPHAFIERHKPEVGGYYVVYGDGYPSFSPAKAFEEGYLRLGSLDLSRYAGQTFYGPHLCACKQLIVRQALENGGQKFDALATGTEYDGNYPSNRPDLPWALHICPEEPQHFNAVAQREIALAMDNSCYTKARARGEQTFTLRAQDRSGPRTICFWIMENIETVPAEKLMDALKDALAMREHPNRKAAD